MPYNKHFIKFLLTCMLCGSIFFLLISVTHLSSVLLKAIFTVSLQMNMDNFTCQRVKCGQKSMLSFIGLHLVKRQEAAAGAGVAIMLYCFMVLK